MKYKEKLEEIYSYCLEDKEYESKLEFIGDVVFDFTTYDGEMDIHFATKMLEVIEVILTNNNFEYQKVEKNYINYITMVNMPFLVGKLDWGTSIRGAWFENYGGGEYEIAGIKMPKTELTNFLTDLIEWSKK